MIVDCIQLRGKPGAPANLLDGEPYIDEADAKLYFAFQASMIGVRLDVQPLPQPSGDPGDVCQLDDQGALAYAPLLGGGGGAPYDDQPWRVPGLTPFAAPETTVWSSINWREFEVTQPTHVEALYLNCDAGADITFGIISEAGDEIISLDKPAEAGGYAAACDITLQPGRYETFVELPAGTGVQVLKGAMRHQGVSDHAVLLKVTQ